MTAGMRTGRLESEARGSCAVAAVETCLEASEEAEPWAEAAVSAWEVAGEEKAAS